VSNPLHRYRILIADPDVHMARVLKVMLEGMGFSDIQMTADGQEALNMVKKTPFDILIAEWNFEKLGNLELINRIRRDDHSPNRALPIVTLTGRAEVADVMMARDCGTTEYVVKPFSAGSVYARLERLVDYPRDFVVSPGYVGPERRTKRTPYNGKDRRVLRLVPQGKAAAAHGIANDNANASPKIFEADYSLKRKLGLNHALSDLITPEVLQEAQERIESISSESLQWIKEDLAQLKSLQRTMMQSNDIGKSHLDLMSETALAISSRAGTFGYQKAAKAAYMLYLFCCKNLDPEKPIHCVIAEKHIDVLQLALSETLRTTVPAENDEIMDELQHLVNKYGS